MGERLPPGVSLEVGQLLMALVHAAHLKRLVVTAPRLDPPFTKQDFAEFSKTVLNDWVVTQAQAIYKIAERGSHLSGYARGVVAVEAGLSDMRFVSVVREVPLPEEMAHDDELREAYYSELDIALTPWKTRGRDAALVGLREFAAAGVLVDARVDRARSLLSELYGGRPIDRLDGLILPELPRFEPRTLEERLAARLPTPLYPLLLPEVDASDVRVLRALLERGIAPPLRAHLESRRLDPQARALLARALIGLGQRYWRAADFESALSLLEPGSDAQAVELRLMRGLAEALENGPRDAADMMLRGPRLPTGVTQLATLDELARSNGPLAGAAGFDAAYLLELVPPSGDPGFWLDLSERYRRASMLLADPDKSRALERADAAKATARALSP